MVALGRYVCQRDLKTIPCSTFLNICPNSHETNVPKNTLAKDKHFLHEFRAKVSINFSFNLIKFTTFPLDQQDNQL